MVKTKSSAETIDIDNLLAALIQFKNGNFSTRFPSEEWTGKAAKIAIPLMILLRALKKYRMNLDVR